MNVMDMGFVVGTSSANGKHFEVHPAEMKQVHQHIINFIIDHL